MSEFEKYIEAKYPNRSPKILFQKFKDIDGTLFYGVKEIEDQAGVWQHQQAKIDELKHQKSLQELAINQISQANQEWQRINSALQKRVDGALNYVENRKLGNGISGDDSSDLNFIIRTLHGDSEHE